MSYVHKDLAAGRWFELTFFEQMGNAGSEVERAIAWRAKGNAESSRRAFERALELVHLTKLDPRNRGRLRELCRVGEALADYFVGPNDFGSSDESWRRYFGAFAYAARRQRAGDVAQA
jgi:hypothetical protein